MSVLNRIAYFQNRRDEVPNQELARELVNNGDKAGIQEIAENLWNTNQNIQSDCLKVLYEIGYLEPGLIAVYAADFLNLLGSKNNRIVWGSMIALSTIARIKSDELYSHTIEIMQAMEQGSVIARDNGVKILAAVAAANNEYRKAIFPYLLEHLESCRPKDVPQHAETILPAVDASTKDDFSRVLEGRMKDLNGTQSSRVKKVLKEAAKRTN